MQTSTTAAAPSLDLEKILHVLRSLPEEPIAAWMKAQGFDPHDGYVLVLPTAMLHLAGDLPPTYVWTSSLVLEPAIIRNMLTVPRNRTENYAGWFQ